MDGIELAQARLPAEQETPVMVKPQSLAAAPQGASCGMCQGSGSSSAGWLGRYRGWILLGGAAVAGTGLALGEGWVTVAGLTPLLYSLPCAVMMIFCMRGMSHGTQAAQNQAQNQTSSSAPPTAADAQPTTELERQT